MDPAEEFPLKRDEERKEEADGAVGKRSEWSGGTCGRHLCCISRPRAPSSAFTLGFEKQPTRSIIPPRLSGGGAEGGGGGGWGGGGGDLSHLSVEHLW